MEIRSLTGLRGLAACYVVVFHFFGYLHDLPSILVALIAHGYIAVDLFFVLSGFVMAFTYAHLFKRPDDGQSYAEFLWKRFARVYPLFFVVLVATIILGPKRASPYDVITNLFLLQAWASDAQNLVIPSWSISTEVAAYIAFPLLLRTTIHTSARNAKVCGAVAMLALIGLTLLPSSLHGSHKDHVYGPLEIVMSSTPFPLVRCFAGFVLGLLAFRFDSYYFTRGRGWLTNFVAAVVVVLLLVHSADIAIVALFVVLIRLLSTSDSLTNRILSLPILVWLGDISYSVYLIHWQMSVTMVGPVNVRLDRLHVPHAYSVTYLAVFALVLLVSTIAYYTIERPARRLLLRAIQARYERTSSKPIP